MATQIKIRRDSYANWYNVNPTLGIGEPGYDTTNRKLKIGDGVTLWRSLSYFDDQVTDLSAYAGSIVPSVDVTHNIGSPTNRWQKGFFSGNAVYLGDIKLSNDNGTLVVQRVTNAGLQNEAAVPSTPGSVTTDRLVNSTNTVSLAANGNLVMPAFTIPNTAGTSGQVLKWPSSGTTLVWSADSNTGVALPTNAVGVLTNDGNGVLSWAAAGVSGGSNVTTGDTPPSGPSLGDLWYDTNSGRTYIYYDSNWIDASPTTGTTSGLSSLSGVTITSPTAGQVLKYNGTAWINDADAVSGGAGVGTVTSVSVASANGFTANVATSSSTPAITIATSISGLLKGNGTAISAAAAGTDYQAPITLTTTGSSGAATFSGNTLNIPQYTGGGASAFSALSDAASSALTVDKIYLPAITRLDVTNNGASAYRFDQYGTTDNATVYAINGTTIAFNLNVAGHPFLIRTSGGVNYNTGLVHVSTTGMVSTGAAAQGQTSGTLYWKIPVSISGNYQYICGIHSGMVGVITIKDLSAI